MFSFSGGAGVHSIFCHFGVAIAWIFGISGQFQIRSNFALGYDTFDEDLQLQPPYLRQGNLSRRIPIWYAPLQHLALASAFEPAAAEYQHWPSLQGVLLQAAGAQGTRCSCRRVREIWCSDDSQEKKRATKKTLHTATMALSERFTESAESKKMAPVQPQFFLGTARVRPNRRQLSISRSTVHCHRVPRSGSIAQTGRDMCCRHHGKRVPVAPEPATIAASVLVLKQRQTSAGTHWASPTKK